MREHDCSEAVDCDPVTPRQQCKVITARAMLKARRLVMNGTRVVVNADIFATNCTVAGLLTTCQLLIGVFGVAM